MHGRMLARDMDFERSLWLGWVVQNPVTGRLVFLESHIKVIESTKYAGGVEVGLNSPTTWVTLTQSAAHAFAEGTTMPT